MPFAQVSVAWKCQRAQYQRPSGIGPPIRGPFIRFWFCFWGAVGVTPFPALQNLRIQLFRPNEPFLLNREGMVDVRKVSGAKKLHLRS